MPAARSGTAFQDHGLREKFRPVSPRAVAKITRSKMSPSSARSSITLRSTSAPSTTEAFMCVDLHLHRSRRRSAFCVVHGGTTLTELAEHSEFRSPRGRAMNMPRVQSMNVASTMASQHFSPHSKCPSCRFLRRGNTV